MSFAELIVIMIVAIIVLGPEKLPKTIIEFAKIMKAVKKQINDAKSTIENEIKLSELKEEVEKYKNEITQTSDITRKKLSFEEFDKIKQTLQSDIDKIDKKEDNNV